MGFERVVINPDCVEVLPDLSVDIWVDGSDGNVVPAGGVVWVSEQSWFGYGPAAMVNFAVHNSGVTNEVWVRHRLSFEGGQVVHDGEERLVVPRGRLIVQQVELRVPEDPVGNYLAEFWVDTHGEVVERIERNNLGSMTFTLMRVPG